MDREVRNRGTEGCYFRTGKNSEKDSKDYERYAQLPYKQTIPFEKWVRMRPFNPGKR